MLFFVNERDIMVNDGIVSVAVMDIHGHFHELKANIFSGTATRARRCGRSSSFEIEDRGLGSTKRETKYGPTSYINCAGQSARLLSADEAQLLLCQRAYGRDGKSIPSR